MCRRIARSVAVVMIGLALASCANSPSSTSASSAATFSEDFIPDPTSQAYIAGQQTGETLMALNPDMPYAKSYWEQRGISEASSFSATLTCHNLGKYFTFWGDVDQELDFKAGCTTALGWSLKWAKP